ncbi:uncharacterized protein ACJ7VT_007366 [Polymixia lowei]
MRIAALLICFLASGLAAPMSMESGMSIERHIMYQSPYRYPQQPMQRPTINYFAPPRVPYANPQTPTNYYRPVSTYPRVNPLSGMYRQYNRGPYGMGTSRFYG